MPELGRRDDGCSGELRLCAKGWALLSLTHRALGCGCSPLRQSSPLSIMKKHTGRPSAPHRDLLAASDCTIFIPVGAAHPRSLLPAESWEHPFLQISGSMVCSSTGKGGCCFEMVFLSVGGGRDPVAREQNLALLPLSKASPGECSQRLPGRSSPCPPCSGSQEGPEFRVSLGHGNQALPTGSWLSWAYLSYPYCLCLQVWLLPRIPAAGENLFSRRGLINACSL